MPYEELNDILVRKEGEALEFKRAENRFAYEDLERYLCALANAGGGMIVFGVSDRRPRAILGTKAFPQPEQVRMKLRDRLRIAVDFDLWNEGMPTRVLAFRAAARPVGAPVQIDGVAWWRDGESLVPMPQEILRSIYAESDHDFSAEAVTGAAFGDLDCAAMEAFRAAWTRKSGDRRITSLPLRRLLEDCGAIHADGGVSVAALVLFGTARSISRLLPQSEICFEYKLRHSAGPADDVILFRDAFFNVRDALWNRINLRNEKAHWQEGLFVWDVPAFNERAVREAVLNAVCHRDYRSQGSVFVRQFPDEIRIESPGGLPAGVTPENILRRQHSRNRLIAELLQRAGLVERSGQGMDVIYEQCIKESKALPSFEGTDAWQVVFTLRTAVLDKAALRFFSTVGEETLATFSTEEFLAARAVMDGRKIPAELLPAARHLADLGILEHRGRMKWVMSRRYYASIGKSGEHTRLTGLDRETNKELLLKHIRDCGEEGAKMATLSQVLPFLNHDQILRLLWSLRDERRIQMLGKRKYARWILTQ